MARGEQILKYRYAAFGFTVIPYAVMSVVNLLANVFLPEYLCLYLVSSPDMEEAIQLGGVFHSIVAAVDFNKELGVRTIEKETWRSRLTWRKICFDILDNLLGFVYFLAAFSALIIVGCMSQFKANDSTVMQRGWIITWTVAGLAFPVIINIILVHGRLSSKHKDLVGKYLPIVGYAPAIGGMIVVGYMIQDYGICTFFS